MSPSSKCSRIILVLLLFGVGVGLTYRIWFPRLGSFLVVADPLEKADVISVLGGGDPQRAIVAAKLYREKWADGLVTTGNMVPDFIEAMGEKTTFAELSAKLASLNGVPPRHITVINEGTSTFEEAEALKSFMEHSHYKSMIVVTSIYHTRRARLVYRKIFKGSGVKIIMRPATGGKLSLDRWWTREEDLIFVNNEYVKLILYLAKGLI
jgi:uncharacterized SAM-binding protein YcdF (DUF218 family)